MAILAWKAELKVDLLPDQQRHNIMRNFLQNIQAAARRVSCDADSAGEDEPGCRRSATVSSIGFDTWNCSCALKLAKILPSPHDGPDSRKIDGNTRLP